MKTWKSPEARESVLAASRANRETAPYGGPLGFDLEKHEQGFYSMGDSPTEAMSALTTKDFPAAIRHAKAALEKCPTCLSMEQVIEVADALASGKELELVPVRGEGSYYMDFAEVLARNGRKQSMLLFLERAGEFDPHGNYDRMMSDALSEYGAFRDFRDDPEFLAVANPLPEGLESEIAGLFRRMRVVTPEGLPALVAECEVLRGRVVDELTILEARAAMLGRIADDLREHGEDNLELYGGGTLHEHFLSEEKAKEEVEVARASRPPTGAFAAFQKVSSWGD